MNEMTGTTSLRPRRQTLAASAGLSHGLRWAYLAALGLAAAGLFLPFDTAACNDCLSIGAWQGSLLQGQDAQVLSSLVSIAALLGILQVLLSLVLPSAPPWVISVARSWRLLLVAQFVLPLAALGVVSLDAASSLSRVLQIPPTTVTFTQSFDMGFYFSIVGLAVSSAIALCLVAGGPRSSWSWPQARATVENRPS